MIVYFNVYLYFVGFFGIFWYMWNIVFINIMMFKIKLNKFGWVVFFLILDFVLVCCEI